ncbi:MAG: hypothetical protein ACXV5L_01075 [Thermoanaerobaculia bacterium]
MAPSKPPKQKSSADKPIRLDDLIPNRNVTGGKGTVFGSAPPTKKKPK